LEELEFAPPLRGVSLDAIERPAGGANVRASYFDLERRSEGLDKVELPDGTHKLAKAGSSKKPVDGQCGDKITKDDEGGDTRLIPEIKSLVSPEVENDQADREPL
jgi:hypothetical protein